MPDADGCPVEPGGAVVQAEPCLGYHLRARRVVPLALAELDVLRVRRADGALSET